MFPRFLVLEHPQFMPFPPKHFNFTVFSKPVGCFLDLHPSCQAFAQACM
jgi:hypothetical protein